MQGLAQGGRALVGIGVAVIEAVVDAGTLNGMEVELDIIVVLSNCSVILSNMLPQVLAVGVTKLVEVLVGD